MLKIRNVKHLKIWLKIKIMTHPKLTKNQNSVIRFSLLEQIIGN